MLKEEMSEVAFMYSDVIGEHPETGGLTVRANGVILLVSKDTAAAHSRGDIQDDAFKKTFHWESESDE
jgi:hypothetical protein